MKRAITELLEPQDLETEGERQLRALLHNQLDTRTSLERCVSRRGRFAPGTMYEPLVSHSAGALSLSQFCALQDKESERDALRDLGFTDSDIQLWRSPKSAGKADPHAVCSRRVALELKVAERQRLLNLPQRFAGSKRLNRREMEIERAMFQGTDRQHYLRALYHEGNSNATVGAEEGSLAVVLNHMDTERTPVRPLLHTGTAEESPAQRLHHAGTAGESPAQSLYHVGTAGEGSAQNRHHVGTAREIPAQNRHPVGTAGESSAQNRHLVGTAGESPAPCTSALEVPPLTLPAGRTLASLGSGGATGMVREIVEVISEEEIRQNRTSLEEIRSIARHKEYHPGVPCRVLRISNLSSKVSLRDLVALFSRFQHPCTSTSPLCALPSPPLEGLHVAPATSSATHTLLSSSHTPTSLHPASVTPSPFLHSTCQTSPSPRSTSQVPLLHTLFSTFHTPSSTHSTTEASASTLHASLCTSKAPSSPCSASYAPPSPCSTAQAPPLHTLPSASQAPPLHTLPSASQAPPLHTLPSVSQAPPSPCSASQAPPSLCSTSQAPPLHTLPSASQAPPLHTLPSASQAPPSPCSASQAPPSPYSTSQAPPLHTLTSASQAPPSPCSASQAPPSPCSTSQAPPLHTLPCASQAPPSPCSASQAPPSPCSTSQAPPLHALPSASQAPPLHALPSASQAPPLHTLPSASQAPPLHALPSASQAPPLHTLPCASQAAPPLHSICTSHDASSSPPLIQYRVLTGRLRGQAFITLPDAQAASSALQLLLGYRLHGRPMIIQYGRKS